MRRDTLLRGRSFPRKAETQGLQNDCIIYEFNIIYTKTRQKKDFLFPPRFFVLAQDYPTIICNYITYYIFNNYLILHKMLDFVAKIVLKFYGKENGAVFLAYAREAWRLRYRKRNLHCEM